MAMVVDMEHVARIRQVLRDAPPIKPQQVSCRQAVRMLASEIVALQRSRGYSTREVAALLTAQGMRVSSATLREYLRSAGGTARDTAAMGSSQRARRPARKLAKVGAHGVALSDAARAPSTRNPPGNSLNDAAATRPEPGAQAGPSDVADAQASASAAASANARGVEGDGPCVSDTMGGVPAHDGGRLARDEVSAEPAQPLRTAVATRARLRPTTSEEGSRKEESGRGTTKRARGREGGGERNADSSDSETEDAIGEASCGELKTTTDATGMAGTSHRSREGSSMGSQHEPQGLEGPVAGATVAPRARRTKDEEDDRKPSGGDRAMDALESTQRPPEETKGASTAPTPAWSFKVREDSEDL